MSTTLFNNPRPVLRDYYVAASVEDALSYLLAHHGEAQLLGGGTLLMPLLQGRQLAATRLVDISGIGPLRRIAVKDDYLKVGGAVTLECLLESKAVRGQAPLLYEAAAAAGTPQVRHLATLAGSLVSAEGNAECLVALVAMEAEAEITNLTGAQWLPVHTLLARAGVSRVDSTAEIVTTIRLRPLMPGQGSALERAAPPARQGGSGDGAWAGRSPLMVAVALALADDDTVQSVSCVLGAAGDVPVRLHAVEQAITGIGAQESATRKALAAAASDEAGARPAVVRAGNGAIQEVRRLCLLAHDRAVKMAQQTRSAPEAASCPP